MFRYFCSMGEAHEQKTQKAQHNFWSNETSEKKRDSQVLENEISCPLNVGNDLSSECPHIAWHPYSLAWLLLMPWSFPMEREACCILQHVEVPKTSTEVSWGSSVPKKVVKVSCKFGTRIIAILVKAAGRVSMKGSAVSQMLGKKSAYGPEWCASEVLRIWW